jgi:hypothetical protein
MRKKFNMKFYLIILLIIVVLFASCNGCFNKKSNSEEKNQSESQIDNQNNELDQNEQKETTSTPNTGETDLNKESQDNNNNMDNSNTEEKIDNINSKIEETNKIANIDFNLNSDFNYDKIRTIELEKKYYIQIDDNDNKIIEFYLSKVNKDGSVEFVIDGTSKTIEPEEKYELERGYDLIHEEGIYIEPYRSDIKSMTEIHFEKYDFESYPEILIESDIKKDYNSGFYKYINSEKISSKYIASYENNFAVTILTNQNLMNFLRNYNLDKSLVKFNYNYIYKKLVDNDGSLDDDSNIVEISWISENKIIKINQWSENVINTYLDKYPSTLDQDSFCMQEEEIEESQTKTININSKDYNINLIGIDESSQKGAFKINDGKTIWLGENDFEIIDSNILLKVKDITKDIPYDKMELCISYE